VNKTCNAYISKRQNGPRAIAFLLFVIWSAPAIAHDYSDQPFRSGFVSCQAAMTRSLTTLLDETFKNFRTASPADKVKALHLVAEVAHEHAQTRQFSESEQLQLGLLLNSIASVSDQEIQPFATELLFIALKLTVNSMAPKIPLFAVSWEQYLKKVMSFETPGYSAHRAAVFGALAILEIQKVRNAEDPARPLRHAFNYVADGWAEDYELALHPTLMVIEVALTTDLPEREKPVFDLAMTELVDLVAKSLTVKGRILDNETFSHYFRWLVTQLEIVSHAPSLANFPKLDRKIRKLKNSISTPSSSILN
jgi:hypothetical protein